MAVANFLLARNDLAEEGGGEGWGGSGEQLVRAAAATAAAAAAAAAAETETETAQMSNLWMRGEECGECHRRVPP